MRPIRRALLGVWMGLVWVLLSGYLPIQFASSELADPYLPPLNRLQSIVFGVWRRWDATHYLRLVRAGYTNPDVGSTVFGPLTPLCIHLLDLLLPGPVDLAAMVFATLSFGLALTMLYRVGEVYYHDRALGQQAIILTVLVADRLRGASRPLRLAAYTLLFALLLTYSALHALGVGPP